LNPVYFTEQETKNSNKDNNNIGKIVLSIEFA